MGLVEQIIERNQSRLNDLNKNAVDSEFDLKYGYLKNKCDNEEFGLVKEKYREMIELDTKIGRVNEMKPPFSEDVRQLIKLKLFFNNLKETANSEPQKFKETLRSLGNEAAINNEKGRRKADGFIR